MNPAVSTAVGVACALLPAGLVTVWLLGARHRLDAPGTAEPEGVAVAQADERDYCTVDLKKVLRRVLTSCGLAGADGTAGRGCQPLDAKKVATMDDDDFNALFLPLADRAAILQFDKNTADLDDADKAVLDRVFAERGGASYFLVVSRSSPEGSVEHNRALSERRGQAVLEHLRGTFADSDLDREVGLLWLGEEYAQLGRDFCGWTRSGGPDQCSGADLNRSAILAWIDCRL